MSKEAVRSDGRSTVSLSGNGKTFELPVPFTPQDGIELSALFPRAMIMCNYATQVIAAYAHGTGEETIIYQNGKVPQ